MGLKDAKKGTVVKDELLWFKNIQVLSAKNGKPYQKITAIDTDGLEFNLTRFEPLIDSGTYAARCEMSVDEYKESVTYNLRQAVKTDKVGIESFMPKAHIEVKKVWGEITQLVKEIERPTLIKLVCRVLTRSKSQFLMYPMNTTGAFARTSGIVEATWELMKLAQTAADTMGADKDLLLAGAALYYIGKVETITNKYELKKDDVLMGSGLSAYTQLYDAYTSLKAEDPEVEDEDMLLLGHILMSRFKGLDTAVPEAAILRYFDAAISSADEIRETLTKVEDGEMIINTSGKKLYKPTKPKKGEKKEGDKGEQPV